MRTLAAALLLQLSFAAAAALAAEHAVRSSDEIEAAMKAAAPGDELVMADGDWRDQTIDFAGRGTEAAPITLRPQTPGGVTLTGTSTLRISGEWLVVDGLRFESAPPENRGHIVQFRGPLGEATNCRLTNTALVRCNPADPDARYPWVSLYGRDNRVDHCRFEGQDHSGVTLCVWLDGQPARHRIDHNHFLDRAPAPGNANGYETIRIGTSDFGDTDAQVAVDDNLFERCDGEIEVVSNKSNGNTFRRNTFLACAGTLTLRHGHRAVVEGNVFLGEGKAGSGGVRVIGEGHRIIGNLFADLDDRAEGAISIAAGIPDTAPSGYQQVKDLVLADNVIVHVAGAAIKADWGVGQRGRSLLAERIRVERNLVQDAAGPFVAGDLGPEWQFRDNRVAGGVPSPDAPGVATVDPLLTRDPAGHWSPVHASSADLRLPAPVRGGDVGPAWWNSANP